MVVDYCGSAVKIELHNRTVCQLNYVHERVYYIEMWEIFQLRIFFLSPKMFLNKKIVLVLKMVCVIF